MNNLFTRILREVKQAYFKTLTWEGPVMPPEYKQKGIKLRGIQLSPLQEEMFDKLQGYSATDYWASPIFQKNQWKCWKSQLPKELQSLSLNDFIKDFSKHRDGQLATKEQKKADVAGREAEKQQKEKLKNKYGFAIVDGEKMPLGNFMIEQPNFMIGRGNAPYTGCWKYRQKPEDITVNIIGDDKKQAELKAKGFNVQPNPFIRFVCTYKQNLMGFTGKVQPKVIGFQAGTRLFASGGEEAKFAKGDDALQQQSSLNQGIKTAITSGDEKQKEAAIIAYIQKVFGIRAGNKETLAGTVGAASLKGKNISVSGNTVSLDFLGKDSVPFKGSKEVEPYVQKALSGVLKGKKQNENVFSVTSGEVTEFLRNSTGNEKITNKNLRTAQAIKQFLIKFNEVNPGKSATPIQKKQSLIKANLQAATELNHQKKVAKNYDEQEQKAKQTLKQKKEKLVELKDKLTTQTDKIKNNKKLKPAERKEKIAALKARVEKAKELIEKAEAALETKKDTKNVQLGTSLGAYLNPKTIFSILNDIDLDPKQIYTPALMKRHEWAKDTPPDYWKTQLQTQIKESFQYKANRMFEKILFK